MIAIRARLSALLTVLFLAGCTGAPVSPWDKTREESNSREKEYKTLGTKFRVRVWMDPKDKRNPETLLRAAGMELGRIGRIADTDNPASELSKTNQRALGGPVPVSADLGRILALGQSLHHRSNGAFDITFAPIQEEVEKHGPDAGLDGVDREYAPAGVDPETRRRVGRENWVFDSRARTVQILKIGTKLVVKGIAKGYAVQKAAEKLQGLKLRGYAVIGGGIMVASGAALDDPNLMCVEDPTSLGHCKYKVKAKRRDRPFAMAMAASFDRPGHVYDPKSATRTFLNGSATIAAEDASWAQGAALSASIMDHTKATRFFDKAQQPPIGAVFIDEQVVRGDFEPHALIEPLQK